MDNKTPNFEVTCRTCKIDSGEMHSIYKIIKNGIPTPVEMLVACTSIQVSQEDEMPRSICKLCVQQLESAFRFKGQCEDSDWFFRQILLNHDVKAETALLERTFTNKELAETDNKQIKEELNDRCSVLSNVVIPVKRKRGRPRKSETIANKYIKMTKTTESLLLEKDYFKCEQCAERFSRKAKLNQHLKTHLNHRAESPCDTVLDIDHLSADDQSESYKLFETCWRNSTYKRKNGRKSSNTSNDLNEGFSDESSCTRKSYECTLCPKKFKYLQRLKQHFPIHLQEKQQIVSFDFLYCELCSEKFIYDDQLKYHMEMHQRTEDTNVGNISISIEGSLNSDSQCISSELKINTNLNENEDDKARNKLVKCPICFKEFERLSRLKQHYTAHLPEDDDEQVDCKIHKCDACSRKFIYYFQLKRHMLIHQNVKPFKCETCKKGFLRKDHLKQHSKIHNVENPDSDSGDNLNETDWRCDNDYDDQKFDQSDNQVDFEFVSPDIKTETNQLKCHICFKEFPRMNRLKQHYATHLHKENENSFNCTIFKCTVCPKKYTYIYQLKRHMITHQNIKPFKCDKCEKTFARKDHLQQHAKTHTKIKERLPKGRKPEVKCEKCDKMFASEKMMKRHMFRAHEETHTCKTCHASFLGKNELHRHWNRANDCGKRHLCPECGMKFISPSILEIHLRRHRGEKPFKCQYCNKGFTRPSDKITHEIRHRGEKNHVCSICSKGFSKSDVLVRHMRTHTGEKPYKCTYCDAAFSQRNDMNTHVRRHTGERFACDMCTEEFLVRYLLSKHKRKVHGVDIPPAKPILERVHDTNARL